MNKVMEVPQRDPIRTFRQAIPVRGCKLGLEDVKSAYRELSHINQKFGKEEVARIKPREGETLDDWENRKNYLLSDAFCLTITVFGGQDEVVYGENESIFDSEDLPKPIRSIYFTNLTAWQRHAGDAAIPNQIEVYLDFDKPVLLDPTLILSDQTPNNSKVSIRAEDMAYFRAVQQVVKKRLLNRQNWYNPIHRSFIYDVGVWILALPVGLVLATFYMEKWFPTGSELKEYRWAFFIYAIGMALICFRILASYTKWAFPVNVLDENMDTARKHRLALGAIFVGLVWIVLDVILNDFILF